MRTYFLVGMLALWTCGCGDALVPGDYEGEPLIQVSGNIELWETDLLTRVDASNIRVSLFWNRNDEELGIPEDFSQEQQVVFEGNALTSYDLVLYHNPPPNALFPINDAGDKVAVAQIVLYADENGDGRWSSVAEDTALGGAQNHVLVYAPQPVESEQVGGVLSTGFHLMSLHEEGSCDGLISMEKQPSNKVNLIVEPYGGFFTNFADVDCDGEQFWCEDILDTLDEIQHEEEEPSEDFIEYIEREYEACLLVENGENPCAFLVVEIERLEAESEDFQQGCEAESFGFEFVCEDNPFAFHLQALQEDLVSCREEFFGPEEGEEPEMGEETPQQAPEQAPEGAAQPSENP